MKPKELAELFKEIPSKSLRSCVSKWRAEFGLKAPNHNNVSTARTVKIKDYWIGNPDVSARKIAKHFDVGHSTVTYWIRKWKAESPVPQESVNLVSLMEV